MKSKGIFNKLFIFITITALCAMLSLGSVAAETTAPDETYAVESFVEETTAQGIEPEYTEGATDPSEDTTGSAETGTTEETTEAEPTYRESLPEISSGDIEIPSAIGENLDENEPSLFWGFVAWVCIGVGAAVIFAVLLTTKTKAYRNGGKKRYSTGDKISGKKRLLSDEYYNTKRKR